MRRHGKAQGISCVTAHASPESPPPAGPVRLPRTLASEGHYRSIHAARLGCLLRRSCGGFGTDRARFRAGHSITLVQRDFTGDAALDWGYAGLRFSDRGALRFRVSGKYQGETHNKTQDQTHSDHFVSLKCLAAD